jgi:hypothetical protein
MLLQYGEGSVDVHLVGGRDLIQHHLQGMQVGKRLTTGKDEIAIGRDSIHNTDAFADFFCAESIQTAVFFFIDTERAVVAAVIGYEDRNGGAAFSGHIGVVHFTSSSLNATPYFTMRNRKNQGSKGGKSLENGRKLQKKKKYLQKFHPCPVDPTVGWGYHRSSILW